MSADAPTINPTYRGLSIAGAMGRNVGGLGMNLADVVTSSDIAKRLNRPAGQVRRVLASRDDFRPCGRAGNVHLYRASIVPAVETQCAAIRSGKAKFSICQSRTAHGVR